MGELEKRIALHTRRKTMIFEPTVGHYCVTVKIITLKTVLKNLSMCSQIMDDHLGDDDQFPTYDGRALKYDMKLKGRVICKVQ